MDKNQIISKLNQVVPAAVLDCRRFGRSQQLSVWVEIQHLREVCLAVKNELQMDWLENLSVVEFEGTLVLSYFVRSTKTAQSLILRVSIVLKPESEWLTVPSVLSIWPMVKPMEQESGDLFGIKYYTTDESTDTIEDNVNYLPLGWKGFPLRKSYQFPKEFCGIDHVRGKNHSGRKPSL